MKPDITNIEDIILFVNEFYSEALQDDLIGPIFARHITDWGPHLDNLYNFWNKALFETAELTVNPSEKHAPLSLGKIHYDRWLKIFNKTIDSLFEGKMAALTKEKAAQMAKVFLSTPNDKEA